jgi:hypothetical protein
MATTPFTLVGNSADSLGLSECCDTLSRTHLLARWLDAFISSHVQL